MLPHSEQGGRVPLCIRGKRAGKYGAAAGAVIIAGGCQIIGEQRDIFVQKGAQQNILVIGLLLALESGHCPVQIYVDFFVFQGF